MFEYVQFSPNVMAFGTMPFSTAFWMRKLDFTPVDVAGNRAVPFHGNFLGFRSTSTSFIVEIDQWTNGYIEIESTSVDMSNGEWHHYCVVRDGAQLKLYVDGVQDSIASSNDGNVANLISGAPFKIGSSSLFADPQWSDPLMDFDELMFFDYALSDSFIQELYDAVSLLLSFNHSFFSFLCLFRTNRW